MSIVSKLNRAARLIVDGRIADLREKVQDHLRAGLYAHHEGYGLRRDLNQPFAAPSARIPIAIREISGSDIPQLFEPHIADGGLDEQRELAWRHEVLRSGFPTCFVAVDQRTDTPCYLQWLISAAQNSRLPEIGVFPPLQPNEALLENAYTPTSYRGLGIMSAAMAMIAERAAHFGARYVITFVARDNAASLKGCERAGFSPYLVRRQAHYGFKLVRKCTFTALPEASALPHSGSLTDSVHVGGQALQN